MISFSLRCHFHKCSTFIYVELVHVLKPVTIVTSEQLNLLTICLIWVSGPRICPLSSKQSCSFNRGNKYKDFLNIFGGVPKEKFYCTH